MSTIKTSQADINMMGISLQTLLIKGHMAIPYIIQKDVFQAVILI